MPTGIVERFLEAMTTHQWDAMLECLADEFTRVGPYGDVYRDRAEYRDFLADLVPKLAGYRMDVTRVTYAGHVAFAELSETVTVDDGPLRTPECLVFELAPDGRISRVEVFVQTWPGGAPT